jgi:uncharacterized membrane protein YcaP (DUF421 family)
VKGSPILLIEDGLLQRQGLWRGTLSPHDLEEALRLQAKFTDPSKVHLAYLERNGSISVIPFRHEPHILTVSVAEGVQTVRIELE